MPAALRDVSELQADRASVALRALPPPKNYTYTTPRKSPATTQRVVDRRKRELQPLIYRERRVQRSHEILVYVIGVLIGITLTEVATREFQLSYTAHLLLTGLCITVFGYLALLFVREL